MKIYQSQSDISADGSLSPTQRSVISETMKNTGGPVGFDGRFVKPIQGGAIIKAQGDIIDGVIVEEIPSCAQAARGHAIPDWAIEEAYYPARAAQRRERALQTAKNMPPWKVREFLARHGIKAKR